MKYPRFVGTIFMLYKYEPFNITATIYVGDEAQYEKNTICQDDATLHGSYVCMKQARYVHIVLKSLTAADEEECVAFCL